MSFNSSASVMPTSILFDHTSTIMQDQTAFCAAAVWMLVDANPESLVATSTAVVGVACDTSCLSVQPVGGDVVVSPECAEKSVMFVVNVLTANVACATTPDAPFAPVAICLIAPAPAANDPDIDTTTISPAVFDPVLAVTRMLVVFVISAFLTNTAAMLADVFHNA